MTEFVRLRIAVMYPVRSEVLTHAAIATPPRDQFASIMNTRSGSYMVDARKIAYLCVVLNEGFRARQAGLAVGGVSFRPERFLRARPTLARLDSLSTACTV